jgi:drug/metabolite transporter (DMT)-like permease
MIDGGGRIAPPLPRRLMKIAAIVLIVLGVLALAYGGFSYTDDKTAVKLGPLELSVKEKKTVDVPVWAGIGAVVVGGLLLAFGGKPK